MSTTDTTTAPAPAPDPAPGNILARYARMLTDQGRRDFNRAHLSSAVSGLIQGAALVCLLPASVALASGRPSWGIGIAGWLWLLAGLAVLGAIVDYVNAIVSYNAALNLIRTIHRRLGDRVAQLPLGWFRSSWAGRMSRMVTTEMMNVGESLAHQLGPFLRSVTAAVVMVIGAFIWDWRLGLVLTVSAPVFIAMLRISQRCLSRGKRISTPAEEELSDRIVEFAKCQGALRSCGRSGSFEPLDRANARVLRTERTDLWWGLLANLLYGLTGQLIVVALTVVAARLALGGGLGPLQAIVFIGISLRFTQTLTEIGENLMGVEERRVQLDRLDEVLHAPAMPEPSDSATPPTPGTVELAGVGFGYLPQTPVLEDVSLQVPAGGMCALVGPSGCGKTTIARLIARFHDVDSGVVRVGGTDVRDQAVSDLMAGLSMVFQDVYLFDDTLEANIRIGNQGASQNEMLRAARLAGVTEIVDRMPGGWSTRVGEGGRAISGGERQRVSVARAILKDAPVVLFDEATSSLDPENEANVVAAMEELRRDATLVVIAHKLDTIRTADQIVVLNPDGTVAQTGRHEDLYPVKGRYRDFCLAREEAENWQLV